MSIKQGIMNCVVLVIVFFFAASNILATPPVLLNASYDYETTMLTLTFDQELDDSYFDPQGFFLGVGPDYIFNTFDVHYDTAAVSVNDNIVQLDLDFLGINGMYSENYDIHYTWGQEFSTARILELYLPDNAIKVSLHEYAVFNLVGEGNTEMSILSGVELQSSGSITDGPQLQSTEFDEHSGVLTFTFDQSVQWDQINEDLANIWYDTLGIMHIDPGNGILDVGEDRNNNSMLDLEKNIFIEGITIFDDSGDSLALSEYAVYPAAFLTLTDSSAIRLCLGIFERQNIAGMNTSSLNISLDRWAFTGLDYRGSIPAVQSLIFLPDDNPLFADSSNYDIGNNELKIYFNGPLSTGYIVPTKAKFSYPGGIYTTTPPSAPPTISASSGYIKIKVNLLDQENIEDLYFSYGGENMELVTEPYMILGADINFNIGSTSDIDFLPESSSNKAPEPDSASYEAEEDILYIHFDVNVKQTMDDVNPDGISLTDGNDTVQIDADSLVDTYTNKLLGLFLTPECAAEVEMILNLDEMFLLIEPFSVLQAPKLNGNRAVTLDDSINVIFVPDSEGPIPEIIRYEDNSNSVVFRFNKTINPASISATGYTYSGIDFEAETVSMDNPVTVRLYLTDANATALAGLTNEEKIDAVIDIAANCFYSTTGAPNVAMSGLTFGTDMSVYGGDFSLLAGWSRIFTAKSYEAFPVPDYEVAGFWRMSGEHCSIFVAEDQLVEYAPNMNRIPIEQTDIDTVFHLIENTTPVIPGEGAYIAVRDIIAWGNFGLVPEICDILIMNILDEYSLGRNNTNDDYFWGCRYEPAGPGGGELIMLDSYPQLFYSGDSAWYLYEAGSAQEEWRIVDPEDYTTCANATVNLLARWMSHNVDSDEEQWVVEGLSSICEQLVVGDVSFYGVLLPTKTLWNSLTCIPPNQTLLKYRSDLFNTYLFFDYLYEKYGGEQTLMFIGEAEEDGMAGIDSALVRSRAAYPLQEPFQSMPLTGIFLDYGVACLLDTTNGGDDRRYIFDNVNLYGTISSSNSYILKWSEMYGPPPYLSSMSAWSFGNYYTYYLSSTSNPMLDPQGNLYFDGLDSLSVNVSIVRIVNNPVMSTPGSQFLVEEVQLDGNNFGSIELSIPGWTFGPPASADYVTLCKVVALTGEQPVGNYTMVINNSQGYFIAPGVSAFPASETSIRLSFDLPWEELGFGGELEGLSGKTRVRYIQSNKNLWLEQLIGGGLDNEGGLIGFSVYRSIQPDTDFVLIETGIDTLSYLDEGLLNGRTYYYRVTADYENPPGSSDYAAASARAQSPEEMSRIATAISNFGNYGEPNGTLPSFEWYNGSGKYYVWEGRFWVGAEVSSEKLVSHATYGNYEWEPCGGFVKTYEVLGIDQFIHITSYHDLEVSAGHMPLGLVVNQTTRVWPLSENEYLADAVMISLAVENTGMCGDLHDVYLAWNFDCDVAGGPGGDPDSPNIDDNVGFDEERLMSYMYDDDDPASPEDDTGEFGLCPGYVGMRLLNSPGGVGVAHHAWWDWNNDPGSDEEKYLFMDGTHPFYNGQQYMPDPFEVGAPVFDYRFLLSIGPFDLDVGESLSAEVALVIGDGLEDLQVKSDSIYALFGGLVSVEGNKSAEIPTKFNLSQNYPNPFNPVTSIKFTIPKVAIVKISVYNILGREVAVLADREYQAGEYIIRWEAANVSSGIYFIYMEAADYHRTLKMVLLR